MNNRCWIIGVLDNGSDGISAEALTVIRQTDLLIGATRTLELFSEEAPAHCEQIDLTGKLSHVPEWINQALQKKLKVTLLATGDPLCHGIGQYLCKKLPINSWRIVPNCSTLQLTFARLGIAWQNAKICSVHTEDAGEWFIGAGPDHGLYPVLSATRQHDLVALFTSPENSPERVIRMLQMEHLATQWEVAVAERLLQVDERLSIFMPALKVSGKAFSSPNFMVLRRIVHDQPTLFGLADDLYLQRKPDKGLITKRDVRAISLARMQLKRHSTVWDIGAGSGSVGLEAARLCPEGYVFAIEKNETDTAIVERNRQKHEITNYQIKCAKAPDGLQHWPEPNAVFIGGSAGQLKQLIELSLNRLSYSGWLVMNFVTLDNLQAATETLRELKAQWDVTQIQISHSKPILEMHRMQAENPVWIVSAQKETNDEH